MTRCRNSLILYAPDKEAEFKLNKKGLNLINRPVLGPTKVYSRITKNDRIMTVDASTNDMTVKDLKTNQIYSQLKGF
jgi:hypothetical protein